MSRRDPEGAAVLADRIIKNTYRTLMTRGMKGCGVYCCDEGFGSTCESEWNTGVRCSTTMKRISPEQHQIQAHVLSQKSPRMGKH